MFNEKPNTSDVKERILQVAGKLFITNGYKGTSVRDIAAASGTNVAMVNYYFHSKYNLFEIIFEEAFGRLQQQIFQISASDMPFFELIEAIIDSYYEMLLQYPQIPVFILNEVNQNSERLSERIRKRNPYSIFKHISERIQEEKAKGTIKEVPPLDFLLNILSLCMFPFMFKNLGMNVANVSHEVYTEMLQNHKEYVKEFVIHSIKK